MLSSPKAACRARAFDLILNLGVHAHLLEPIITDSASTIEEEYSQESYFGDEAPPTIPGMRKAASVKKMGTSSAIDNFESWILNILFEILLLLIQVYFLWHHEHAHCKGRHKFFNNITSSYLLLW